MGATIAKKFNLLLIGYIGLNLVFLIAFIWLIIDERMSAEQNITSLISHPFVVKPEAQKLRGDFIASNLLKMKSSGYEGSAVGFDAEIARSLSLIKTHFLGDMDRVSHLEAMLRDKSSHEANIHSIMEEIDYIYTYADNKGKELTNKALSSTQTIHSLTIQYTAILVFACLLLGFGFHRSVSYLRQRESELDDVVKLASRIFDSSKEAFIITNAHGIALMTNKSYEAVTGYPAESTIGIQFKDLPCLKGLSTIAEIWTSCQLNRGWSGDVASINKSGQSYCRHLTIDPICDGYATVTNYIIKFYDISDRKRLESEILYQTQYDEATNLPNRRFLYKVMQNLIYDSSPSPFALLFIDVDKFKQINDTYGHHVGDMFLQQFSTNMRNCVRTTDFVSRYAGDEFIVILKGIVPSTVRSAITKVFNELINQPIAIGDICIDVRISVGVVIYPEGGTTEDSLISHADTAMYQAKGHGRCQVYYYNNESEHTEDYRLENALVHSIRTHGMSDFHLVYQPQVRLDTRVMTGGEALLRWTSPEGKLVPPSEFIPILESNNNMIIEVGEWVLRQACTDFKDLIDYTICVNVSLKQIRHFNFVDMVTRVLFETGFDPLRLELEVTESLFIADNVGLSKMLMELVGMGIKISIDDFGTGYSSLSRLINLPITKLKIDGLFMQSFEDNPHSKQVIHTIVQIGKDLNLTVLAEGVETKEQVDYLMSTGCGFVQGYYFSRPISLEAFKAFGLNSLEAMPVPLLS